MTDAILKKTTAAVPADGLSTVITSLAGIIDQSESDFMLLGIGLRSVHSNVTELTDLMLGTVRQVTAEEDGGFLEQGRRILRASLAEIRNYHEGVKADLKRINTVLDDLESLRNTGKQIKQFARSLKAVALIMLVENGRSLDSSVSIFSTVAREIKDLSVNITAIANDVYQNVEKAGEMHRASREEISASIKRLEMLTGQIEVTVQQSAYETEMLMQVSVEAVERAGRRSQDISRQVAEIVVGVQFHDNMKQRIERIIDVIQTIVDADHTASGCEPGVPADGIVREQAGLLHEINNEVGRVYQINRNALKGIEKEVTSLITGLEGMDPDDAGGGSIIQMRDPFAHLQDTLKQLHGLLDRGQVLYNRIRKTAEHVADITTELSHLLTVVRGISSHTHNKAINSIIAADHQGLKAGAMKLLAQEMNALASRSDIFTREVAEIIHSIVGQAGDIGRRCGDRAPGGDNAGGAINRLNEVLNDISLAYESFRKDSVAAFDRAGGLKRAIDTTFTGLDFFKGLSDRIDQYERRLSEIAGQPGLAELLVKVDAAGGNPGPGNLVLFENIAKLDANTADGPENDHTLGGNVEFF